MVIGGYGLGAVGSGSGGGVFHGTQTYDPGATPLIGFFGVAPLVVIRNTTTYPTVLQTANYVDGGFDLERYTTRMFMENAKAFFVSHLIPCSLSVSPSGGGWSYVVFHRPDGAFEVFALVWSALTSYCFAPALMAFHADAAGTVSSAGSTQLRLDVSGTVALPQPPYSGVFTLPTAFLSQATLSKGAYTSRERLTNATVSPILTNWVLSATSPLPAA